MADELGVDTAFAVERFFKREDDEHAVDIFAYEPDALLLPGPELGADEEDDGDAEAVELGGEAEMDVREIDEDGDGGMAIADCDLQAMRNSR